MTPVSHGRAVAAVVLASALWGTIGLVQSYAPDAVPSSAVGAAAMGFGGLVLLALAPGRAMAVLADRRARAWTLLGAAGVIAYPLALYPSMRTVGVAIANVVALGSGPVFAALIEWALERRRPSARWALATALAIAGIAAVALGGRSDVSGGSAVVGVLLALVSGLGYAVYAYASARAIRRGHASTPAMGAMFGAAAVVLVPVSLVWGGELWTSWPGIAVGAYLALGPLALAYVLFGLAVRSLSASTATTITLLEPVVATSLAVLVLHESLTALAWAGIALVLAAVVLVSARSQPAKATSAAGATATVTPG